MFRTIDALTKMRREEERRRKVLGIGGAEAELASGGRELASGVCELPVFETRAKEDAVRRRSPDPAEAAAPNEANSEGVRQECRAPAAPNEAKSRNRRERRRQQALARLAERRRSGK
jgi:hypothetical protein